jgi:hypothetical protein
MFTINARWEYSPPPARIESMIGLKVVSIGFFMGLAVMVSLKVHCKVFSLGSRNMVVLKVNCGCFSSGFWMTLGHD